MECDYPVMAASGGAAAQPAPRPGAEQDGWQRGRGAGGSPQPGWQGRGGRKGGVEGREMLLLSITFGWWEVNAAFHP